jgi:ABC-type glycerol-3-phosphate transport system permease component
LDFINNPFGLPEEWIFTNYSDAFELLYVTVTDSLGTKDVFLSRLFINSVIYAIGCGFMHTLAPCLVAYAVAKYKFKFSGFLYNFVIITMLLPSVGTLASEITIVKAIGFYDSFLGMFGMRFSFLGSNFLIFYAAFKSLPNDFKEAAEMDGASQLQVLLQIVLPLVKTTIGAIALLSFITYWNDYTTAMIFLPNMPTIAYGLQYFTSSSLNEASTLPVKIAACTMVIIPIFIVFVIFKDKLIGNMAVGGIKG